MYIKINYMATKIIVALSVLLFTSIAGISQTVKLIDLINKSACKDNECFHDFITTKGFSPADNATQTGGTFWRYQSDAKFTTTSNRNITTANQSIYVINADGTYGTGFGSSTKAHYQPLLNELVTLGFQKKSSVNKYDETKTIETVYKSSRYPKIKVTVSIMILSLENEKWTYYDFAVNRTL